MVVPKAGDTTFKMMEGFLRQEEEIKRGGYNKKNMMEKDAMLFNCKEGEEDLKNSHVTRVSRVKRVHVCTDAACRISLCSY